MLLAADVGNSQTLIGLFSNGELARHWRLGTDPTHTPDEMAMTLAGLLRFEGLEFPDDVDGAVVGSVVPSVTEVYREMLARYVPRAALIVGPGVRTGLPMKVDNPREIGADRIVNAVAAQELYGAPSIVVDFGTATSFEAIDRDGVFVGGAIAPGIRVSSEALIEHAARLPKVETLTPTSPIGRSTVAALQAGIVYGFAGQVDAIIDRISAELGPGVTTVATGGLASAVLGECRRVDHHDPWLTLKGLRLLWERNLEDG